MDPLRYLTNCKVYSTASQADDEEAWLKARTRGLGGSDVGAICGVSPFTSDIAEKIDYILEAYDDDMRLKTNTEIHMTNLIVV